jgi:hypothetical protein
MITLLQIAAIAFFTCGAWLYYGIRRLLFARGYPISNFVYSGNCWPHYRNLIEKSSEPEQRQLKLRKTCMTFCFAVAGLLVLIMPVVAPRS